jgi:NitT/TauT family transport system permease protein
MQRSSVTAATAGQAWPVRMLWLAGSFLGLLLFWELSARIATDLFQYRYLPGPSTVAEVMLRELRTGDLAYHISITLRRVAITFVVSMLIGIAIGIALGRVKWADQFFDGWLIFFLNLPALVIICLCYVWFGREELAAIIAVSINKIPNVAVLVREGARSLSKDLAEMAHMYSFGWWKTMRHVTLPQLAPFFMAAARSGLSLVWKIVLVVELLGRSNGVGFQLGVFFQTFDVAAMLAYSISFIIVVQLIETCILQPISSRVSRWRR